MRSETWISVDVETSGPTPGTGSLLAIGACLVDRPEEGIELLLRPDPALPWSSDAEAVHHLSRDFLVREGLDPGAAMGQLAAWLERVVPAGGVPRPRLLQRPLRLDVRGRLRVAAPGPQPVRDQRPGPQGALPGPPPGHGRAVGGYEQAPRSAALPGRPAAHPPRPRRRPRAGRDVPAHPRRSAQGLAGRVPARLARREGREVASGAPVGVAGTPRLDERRRRVVDGSRGCCPAALPGSPRTPG